jgi:TorA maturation chaperone TorD
MPAIAVSPEERSPVVVYPEDETRAACYGLIAHLFSSPPSDAVLRTIASMDLIHAGSGALYSAWRHLQQNASSANPVALRQEFDDLFIGVGKPQIALHGCYYLTGFLMEKPLSKLRDDLSELGFSRQESARESEDHIAALCEVMRVLVAGHDDMPPAPVEAQTDFFRRHLAPWMGKLTSSLERNAVSTFYANVGRFMHEFFQVENESFEIV